MGVTFAPTTGEGEGVVGIRDLREARYHNKLSQPKAGSKAATFITRAGATANSAHGHTFAQDAVKCIPGQLAQTSKGIVRPLVQSNLGSAPSLQQQVGSTQALSGRCAAQAGDTQPVGHALQQRPPGPVHSGKRSQSVPLTQPRTTTHHSPEHTLANSPINIINLRKELDKYEKVNRVHADELRYGFSDGFKLGYMEPRELKMSKNLVSANENSEEVLRKIRAEIEKGRVGGPFESPPFTNMRCSPIGLVPKKAPGEFRLIHHLSWPEGNSGNVILTQKKPLSSIRHSTMQSE